MTRLSRKTSTGEYMNDKTNLPSNQQLIDAASHADWDQVVMNLGPPCFNYEADRKSFCLRAQRWEGHELTEFPGHAFVTLEDLLRQVTPVETTPRRMTRAEAEAMERAFWASVEIIDDDSPVEPTDGHDWPRKISALLDGLGHKAIRVREGGGQENLMASLAVTLSRHLPSEPLGHSCRDGWKVGEMKDCALCISENGSETTTGD